jgi:hypothetical protein
VRAIHDFVIHTFSPFANMQRKGDFAGDASRALKVRDNPDEEIAGGLFSVFIFDH